MTFTHAHTHRDRERGRRRRFEEERLRGVALSDGRLPNTDVRQEGRERKIELAFSPPEKFE